MKQRQEKVYFLKFQTGKKGAGLRIFQTILE